MRVAVISDIHGNFHALEAALAAVEEEGPDAVWCLGDLVGYGPRPNECCARVAEIADVCLIGERGKYPPFGVNGGGPAALNRFIYETDQGEMTPPMVSKVTDIRIRRGQKVRLETPGGGGFGHPATREPARVVRDVELGYISRESARSDYRVVLRDDGTLDAEATMKARAGTPA